ncbi:DUF6388 family protein [Pseudomonas sp. DC3200b2]|uniref:DUF6388 family protein n=1 Tax=Pseudomonas sp. DC3200b2 TaxID=2804669 RepID=UPI003CE9AD5D
MLNDAQQQLAYDRFLAAHPELVEEIGPLAAHERQQQVAWAFEDEAEARGLEPWEYTLELTASGPEELAQMREAVHRQVAEALGMAWEDYRTLNGL